MSEWSIGLSSWIVQDGNYSDFVRHDRRAFALEFYPLELRPSSIGEIQATSIGPGRYRVNAKVIESLKGVWVIDFGIQAFQQADPKRPVTKGSWIDADIYLGIDPFFYFEDLSRMEEMPPLIYEWVVHEITIQTAPFIETRDEQGRRILTRDESKSAYREIDRTDAWNDDNGHGEYVMRCALTGTLPRKTLE